MRRTKKLVVLRKCRPGCPKVGSTMREDLLLGRIYCLEDGFIKSRHPRVPAVVVKSSVASSGHSARGWRIR